MSGPAGTLGGQLGLLGWSPMEAFLLWVKRDIRGSGNEVTRLCFRALTVRGHGGQRERSLKPK